MSTHKQYITHQAEPEYKDPSTDQEPDMHKMPRNKQGTLTRQISRSHPRNSREQTRCLHLLQLWRTDKTCNRGGVSTEGTQQDFNASKVSSGWGFDA